MICSPIQKPRRLTDSANEYAVHRIFRAGLRHQLNDEHHRRYHQERMNQTPAHVETKSEEPENYENYDDRPKHSNFA